MIPGCDRDSQQGGQNPHFLKFPAFYHKKIKFVTKKTEIQLSKEGIWPP
jgi:hypothetical protein